MGKEGMAVFTCLVSSQIEFARKNMQGAQDKLSVSWAEWKRNMGYDDTDESHCAEVRPCHRVSL